MAGGRLIRSTLGYHYCCYPFSIFVVIAVIVIVAVVVTILLLLLLAPISSSTASRGNKQREASQYGHDTLQESVADRVFGIHITPLLILNP